MLAAQFGYEVVALNAASRDNRRVFLDGIRTTLHPTTLHQYLHLNTKPKLLLIEEINAIVSSGKGSAELKTLLEQLADAQRPLICITDARGEEGIRRLVHVSARVEFTLPEDDQVAAHLAKILSHARRLDALDDAQQALCRRIATACQGNVRQAITRLQCAQVNQGKQVAQPDPNLHDTYMRFYDAHGHRTLNHTLKHMLPSRGKNRGRKPTKKSCYADDDKTTKPHPGVLALKGVAAYENVANVSAALVEAEHLRAHMARDHDDLETECVDELAPYLAYFACGVPFTASPLPIPLDRIECPSHSSTCKRYVSNIHNLLAHLRHALYESDAPLQTPPDSVLFSDERVFCTHLLTALKHMFTDGDLVQAQHYVRALALNNTKLEFMTKCATYTGQKRNARELDRERLRALQRNFA